MPSSFVSSHGPTMAGWKTQKRYPKPEQVRLPQRRIIRELNLDPSEVPKIKVRKRIMRKFVIDEICAVGPRGARIPLVRRRPERQLTLS